MDYAYYADSRPKRSEAVDTITNDKQVWYHHECWDGFGAAYAAWKRFGNDATYVSVQHGNPPPDFVDGEEVYILDFSYDKDALLDIDGRASLLVVLDHHESARKQLEDLPFATFDMEKSGAVLAWEYFHSSDVPELLLYIQDRDLWRWELPDSREINYALQSHPFDFELWDWFAGLGSFKANQDQMGDLERELAALANSAAPPTPEEQERERILAKFKGEDGLSELRRDGVPIVRMIDAMIDRAVSSAFEAVIDGQKVMVANSLLLRSEIADRLIQMGSPIAATFSDGPKGRLWSLRSRDDEHDVSVIASKYGGGGHKQASGFLEEKPGKHVRLESVTREELSLLGVV